MDALRRGLEQQLSAFLHDPDLPACNTIIDIAVPARGIHVCLASPGAQVDAGIHWASVAKSLTALLILRQLEQGSLPASGLDTPLSEFAVLPDDILAQLHCGEQGNRGGSITVDQLLRHTAGIRDAMCDDVQQTSQQAGGLAPGSLVGKLLADPQSSYNQLWPIWDPDRPSAAEAGTLNSYFAHGLGQAPLAAPGQRFSYSDTGYVLLGLLLEAIAGMPLHRQLREQVFEPLGLQDAYLAYREPVPAAVQAESDVFMGDTGILASGFTLSFDWGGGGIVSSVTSMNRILQAIIGAELLSPENLQRMLDFQTPDGLKPPRTGVGRGMFRTSGSCGELWGHSGSWGAKMFYQPESELYFSGTVNQVFAPADWHWRFIETTQSFL